MKFLSENFEMLNFDLFSTEFVNKRFGKIGGINPLRLCLALKKLLKQAKTETTACNMVVRAFQNLKFCEQQFCGQCTVVYRHAEVFQWLLK